MRVKAVFVFLVLLAFTSPSRTEQRTFSYRLVPGEALLYRFRYGCDSNYDLGKVLGVSSSTNQTASTSALVGSLRSFISGEAYLAPFAVEGENTLILCRFQILYISLVFNGQRAVQDERNLENDLKKRFLILMNKYGEILELKVCPEITNIGSSYLRTILSLFQVVFPKKGITNSWETKEACPSGFYVASYKIEKKGNKRIVVLTKTRRYLAETGPEREIVTTKIIPEGETHIKLDIATGITSSIRGKEAHKIYMFGKEIANVKEFVAWDFVKREIMPEGEVSKAKGVYAGEQALLRSITLYIKPSPIEVEGKVYREILGGATLESILLDFEKVKSEGDYMSLYLKLKALIYLHPEVCAKLGEILTREYPQTSALGRLILSALSSVGNPEAQEAILHAIRANMGEKEVLMSLLSSFLNTPIPTKSAVDTVFSIAFECPDKETASTAQLILGVMANKLKYTAPDLASQIVDEFIRHLEFASSNQEKVQLLLALGNAGSSRALPILHKFSQETSPDIRAIAFRAMRFIEDEEAEEALLKSLANDIDLYVRRESALALSYRRMSKKSYLTHMNIFKKSDDLQLRLQLLRNLFNSRELYPEILPFLRETAKRDRQKEVRELAQDFLNRIAE